MADDTSFVYYAVDPFLALLNSYLGISAVPSQRDVCKATLEHGTHDIWCFFGHTPNWQSYLEAVFCPKQRTIYIAKTCIRPGIRIEMDLDERFIPEKVTVTFHVEEPKGTGFVRYDIEQMILDPRGVIRAQPAKNGKDPILPCQGVFDYRGYARALVNSSVEILPLAWGYLRSNRNITMPHRS